MRKKENLNRMEVKENYSWREINSLLRYVESGYFERCLKYYLLKISC